MNWFDRWLANKVKNYWHNSGDEKRQITAKEKYALSNGLVGQAIRPERSSDLDSHPDLNFRMFRAENGYVMEVRQYDRRTDRHTTNLHLISDAEDLGDSISKIITVETLRGH